MGFGRIREKFDERREREGQDAVSEEGKTRGLKSSLFHPKRDACGLLEIRVSRVGVPGSKPCLAVSLLDCMVQDSQCLGQIT